MRTLLLWSSVLCAIGQSPVQNAAAEDFRIETNIYQADNEEPVARNLTLFQAGRVYDFVLVDGQESAVTIYDPLNEKFVLLLNDRQVKTTIDANALLKFTSHFKVRASESKDPLRKFCAVPEFTEVFDEAALQITLRGEQLSYKVTGAEPANSALLKEYRQFSDWFARLNSARPGGLPPFARLELNKAIANKQIIPTQVERTIHPQNSVTGRPQVARSQHEITLRLLDKDRQRIERAGENLSRYKSVTFDQFYEF